MRLEERRMRGLLGRVAVLVTLLVAVLFAGPGPAFAQSSAEDQYASAAADQYKDTTGGRLPAGPQDSTHPSLPDSGPSQADPSEIPVSPEARDSGASLGPLSALLGMVAPSTTTLGDPSGHHPTAVDRCIPGPGVACVGGGDPLPPPAVVDQCTPGPGVACIGGGAPPGPIVSYDGGAGSTTGPAASLIGSLGSTLGNLLGQANASMIADWLVDDPGDSDRDGAVSTDLNPGSYDADPTDHDGDNRVYSDPDGFDPNK